MPPPAGTATLVGKVLPGIYRVTMPDEETLCPDHGDPLTANPKEAIRRVKAQDATRKS